MRLMTTKELNKIFSLRQSRSVKSRVRKKNHKRAMKQLDKYGLVTVDMLRKISRNAEGDATLCEKCQKETQAIVDRVILYLNRDRID